MVLAMVLAFVGCAMPDNVVLYTDVNVVKWSDKATVELDYKDEPRTCDMDMLFHINRHFIADTLSLEITTITPDSLRYTEKLCVPVAVEWNDSDSRSVDLSVPYRRDVTLDRQGVYAISIRPVVPVSGVESAGVNFQMK